MAYDDQRLISISLTVAAMQTANTDDLLCILPQGFSGRLVGASVFLTTGVTTAPCVFTVGSSADDTTYGTLSVPISAVNTSPAITVVKGTDIAPNATIWLGHAGAAGAGAGLVTLYFEVYE